MHLPGTIRFACTVSQAVILRMSPACFTLHIIDLNGTSETETRCPEEFFQGIHWEGLTIHSPGVYTQSYMSSEGCPYDSTKEYLEYPEPVEGFIDTVICGDYLTYEGDDYFNPGTYTLYYEGGSSYGCDSFATLALDLTYIEAETDFHCDSGSFVLTSNIVIALPSLNGLIYKWYRNGTLVSTDPSFTTLQDGTYTLFVSYYQCTFPALTNPIVIHREDLVPPKPDFDQYSDIACANHDVLYSVVADTTGEIKYYQWSIDPQEVQFTSLDSLNSSIQVNWQGVDSGTVCVHAVNECGDGHDTCFTVTVIPASSAAFTMPTQACADSAVTIQFTGTG